MLDCMMISILRRDESNYMHKGPLASKGCSQLHQCEYSCNTLAIETSQQATQLHDSQVVACGLKLAKTLKWVLLTLAILAILMSVLFIDEIIFGALNSSALCRDQRRFHMALLASEATP